MSFDQEGQHGLVPLDVFHTSNQLVTRYVAIITAEVIPDLGEQALKVGRHINRTRVQGIQVAHQFVHEHHLLIR